MLEDALATIEVTPTLERAKRGLVKLIEDASEFSSPVDIDAGALRNHLFERASAERKAGTFHRHTLISEQATRLGVSTETVESALFSDLRQAQILVSSPRMEPHALVDLYEESHAQAVLLRATHVTVVIRSRSPHALRAVFRQLKFLQLLFTIEREGNSHRLEISGPMSLFTSSTKYGLKLALLLPILRACDEWSLCAEVLWGHDRTRCTFSLDGAGVPTRIAPELPDELRILVDRFRSLNTSWRVAESHRILNIAGLGTLVPDLVFTHDNTSIYFELLGHWSREAVWRRVELAREGLGERVLFAAGEHLRVSPEVLEPATHACLYVYKRTLSARAIAERLDRLAAFGATGPQDRPRGTLPRGR